MSNLSKLKPAALNRLFDWRKAHLYLSLANILATVIALAITVEVIENCINVNQLQLGVLAIPFIVCLDILLIALVGSLFVRRPSGFCLYLGFIAILIVPNVASIVVIDIWRGLSGVNHVSNAASSRLIEGIIILALSILYLWDIVNRLAMTKQSKVISELSNN